MKVVKIIVGIILVIASLLLLWCNEGKYINYHKTTGNIKYTEVSSEVISASNDKKNIYTTGPISSQELYDDRYDVNVDGQILIRKVEIYQWVEKKDNNGNISYTKEWTDEYIDSEEFKYPDGHTNVEPTVEGTEIIGEDLRLGSYKLSNEQISTLEIKEIYNDLSDSIAKDYNYRIDGNYYTTSKESGAEAGDIRISFIYSAYKNMSIIGIQNGDIIEDYVTSSGKNISKLYPGEYTANDILNSISDSNSNNRLIFRVLVVILCYIGIYLVISKNILKNKLITNIGFTTILLLVVSAIRWYTYYSALSALLLLIAIIILVIESFVLKKSKK